MSKTIERKGIVLAGGMGTRMYPSTLATNKHLLNVYNKPMIFYSVSILMLAGIKDILIISDQKSIKNFRKLFSNLELGVKFRYAIQNKPKGIVEGLTIATKYFSKYHVAMILGDNFFYGTDLSNKLEEISKNEENTVFAVKSLKPQDFGVVSKINGKVKIEEKPKKPLSDWIVTGLYFYNPEILKLAKKIKPSKRGELEITDLNNLIIKENKLNVEYFGRGYAWLDMGTHENLLKASEFIDVIENRTAYQIACLEEISLRKGFITKNQLKKKLNLYPEHIKNYLKDIFF